jgi:hypothetical protein
MDAFDAILSDPEWSGTTKTKAPAFDSSQTYGTPSKILDNLAQIESSGNATAINPQTKAMGTYQFLPETVASLHNQGVKFNPFDPNESRAAADYYLSQLTQQNGGDYSKALAQYGGFKKKDPSSYVNRAMARVQTTPSGINPEGGITLNIETQSQPDNAFDAILRDPEGKDWTPTPTAQEQAKTATTPAKPSAAITPSSYSEVPEYTPEEIAKGSAPFAAAADVVTGGLAGIAKTSAYWLSRISGKSPEESEKIAQRGDILENPVGKFSGLMNTPEYQNSLPVQAANLVGQAVNYPGQKLSEATGLHPLDAQYGTNFLMMAVPEAAGLRGAMAADVARGTEAQTQGVLQAGRARAMQARNGFPPEISEPTPTPIAPAGSVGAAGVTPEAMATQASPELQAATQPAASPLGTSKPTAPDTPLSEVKYAENGLPLDEQYARAQTLNRVLGSDYAADLSAIEGNGKERATNYATSNTDTPIGNFLKEKFADEQKRLADFAERQIKNTGGTVGLDESTVYKRGNTILKPLQNLETYFDNAISKIYAERDALAKDIPVEAQNIMKVLNDESLTLANTETIGLTNIAKARMKQLGMIDKDDNLLPTDAKTAENFRKFVNENWDRKNANLHRPLKEAVDTDVLANLDTNTPFYKDARALVELRKNTLENPNGISKILDAEGPKGINRKVQIEKIAQNIADMPVDQITHVIDTLKGVPPELQPQATAALSEIKAQFANRVAEQTPRQITKYMNDNREVMNRVFTPDEMANLRDYHNAVHILATDTGYKGAAVQKINVEQKLGSKIKEHLVSKGAALGAEAVTGGTTMGVAALVTNELLSQRAAKRQAKVQAQAEQQAFENTQKRFVPIQDLIKK